MISEAKSVSDGPFDERRRQPMAKQDLSKKMQKIMGTIVNEQRAREEVRSLIDKARSTSVNKIMELMMMLESDSVSIHDSAVREEVERRHDKLAATLFYFFLERNPELFIEQLAAMSDSDLDTLAYRIFAKS
jgi:hypothetical protein